MLERFFVRPETVDRIRASWLGGAIETYVRWLDSHQYSARCIYRRVPLLVRLGDFARRRGVSGVDALDPHVKPFVDACLRRRSRMYAAPVQRRRYFAEIRTVVDHFLRVIRSDGIVADRAAGFPLSCWAPGYERHLRHERGLAAATVTGYATQLSFFERFVAGRGIDRAVSLTPAILDAFIEERRSTVAANSLGPTCSALRSFLRYLFRERLISRDLAAAVDGPRRYSLSGIPRAIGTEDLARTIRSVDTRGALGRRDLAMLLLLAVYGLRASEVAALTLDDLDWRAAILRVRARKAGHAAAYPLRPDVGDALLDYIRRDRPQTSERRVFFSARAPRIAVTHHVVSARATLALARAGVTVQRAGAHTLRHACAQRMVDAGFALKVIGDFLGHRQAASTRIYTKTTVEDLREVALGDIEDLL